MNIFTIPKTIHYCWFGKNDLPPLVKKCIKSWHKYLPDYEFKLWDEQSLSMGVMGFKKNNKIYWRN